MVAKYDHTLELYETHMVLKVMIKIQNERKEQ